MSLSRGLTHCHGCLISLRPKQKRRYEPKLYKAWQCVSDIGSFRAKEEFSRTRAHTSEQTLPLPFSSLRVPLARSKPRSEKTLPTCFVLSARTTKFFFFICFLSWRMQTLQQAQEVWRVNSQISQDGTFVHYPLFVLNIPLYTLSYRNCFPLFVCFDILWQLTTTHARETHATGTQIVRAKMMSVDAIFAANFLSLLWAFYPRFLYNSQIRLLVTGCP